MDYVGYTFYPKIDFLDMAHFIIFGGRKDLSGGSTFNLIYEIEDASVTNVMIKKLVDTI